MDTKSLSFKIHEINTERLLLRKLTEADAPSLLKIYSDKKVIRFCDLKIHTSLADSISFIKSKDQEIITGKGMALGVEFNGILIGTCRFYHFNHIHRFVSIGFELNKLYWGKGLMKEALTAGINYLFEKTAFNRVEAQVYTGNTRSIHLLERLKFQKEGLMRENFLIEGKMESSFLYSLLRADWKS